MKEPLHSTIASRAASRILSGEWAPGSRIPPERELCRLLDVSRATLRLALAELEDRGLISRHQGRGTFVARPRGELELAGYFSIGSALRARGLEPVTRVVSLDIVEASRHLATDLGILPGDPLVRLERLRLVDGDPLLLETSHLPAAVFPGLESKDLTARSLYGVLDEDYRCSVATATETLEPVITTPEESGMLGVPRHAPAFLVRRVTYDATQTPVESGQALLRGDRSRFLLQLRVAGVAPWSQRGPLDDDATVLSSLEVDRSRVFHPRITALGDPYRRAL